MFTMRTSRCIGRSQALRRGACATMSAALVASLAQGIALADTSVSPVKGHHIRSSTPMPRVVPKKLKHLEGKVKRRSGRRLARLAALDPSGRVDSLAYCQYNQGLLQMTSSGGLVQQPGYWQASTSHPYRVIPTISGSQWIAFHITSLATDGSVPAQTHWYWGHATNPAGYFEQFYSSDIGGWYFQDATTGQRVKRVDLGLYPRAGYGVRFRMDVAWYTNGVVSRTSLVNVPWTTTTNSLAFCGI
jgi:hypothetical protein